MATRSRRPAATRTRRTHASTRNQLSGTVTEVTLGSVMATVKVRLDGGDQIVTASITKEAAVELGLAEGTKATVLVKSTEVMLGVD